MPPVRAAASTTDRNSIIATGSVSARSHCSRTTDNRGTPSSAMSQPMPLRLPEMRSGPPERNNPDALRSWVTMCTSMLPDSRTTTGPTPSDKTLARRLRRGAPSTIWDALTPRENSRIDSAMSDPVTMWNEPPSSSTKRRWRASTSGEPPLRPSVDVT
jgi:hypothetical protein